MSKQAQQTRPRRLIRPDGGPTVYEEMIPLERIRSYTAPQKGYVRGVPWTPEAVYAAQVKQPEQALVARSRVQKSQKASIKSSSNGILVSHTEYLSDLSFSTSFTVQSWIVNPGNSTLFPWLSAIASSYDGYTFESLELRYTPRCSTSSAGSVMLSWCPDAADRLPTSKQEMYGWKGTTSGAPWQSIRVSTGLRSLRKVQYASDATMNTASDYANGRLILGAIASAAIVSGGELYLSYRVRLEGSSIVSRLSTSGGYAYFVPAGTVVQVPSAATAGIVVTSTASTVTLTSSVPFTGVVSLVLPSASGYPTPTAACVWQSNGVALATRSWSATVVVTTNVTSSNPYCTSTLINLQIPSGVVVTFTSQVALTTSANACQVAWIPTLTPLFPMVQGKRDESLEEEEVSDLGNSEGECAHAQALDPLELTVPQLLDLLQAKTR